MSAITNLIGIEWTAIIIIVITLIAFANNKVPVGVVAMGSAIALALFGCMPVSQVYAGWSSSLMMLLMGMMIVGDAMFETGVVIILGRSIMKTKAAQNERLMIVVIMAISGCLSAFLSNTATVAAFIPLIGAMVAGSGGKLKNKHLLMPLGFATALGGTCTLIGSTPQPAVNAAMELAGIPGFKMFDFLPVAGVAFVIAIVYMATIGYSLSKRVLDFDDVTDEIKADDFGEFKPTGKTYISAVTMILCIVGFVTGQDAAMVSLIGALIVILTKCVDFKKCVRKMDWNTLFVMAFAQGIAAGLNDSGAGEMIANAAVRYVGENKILQLVACIVVVTVLTNIMSSTAVAAMMAPIYLQICSSLGSSPYPFMMAIAVGASLTTSTPIGSTAVTMTMVGGYRFSDFFKIGFLLNIFILISTAIIVPLLWTP